MNPPPTSSSSPLGEILRDEIAREGPMRFRDFMARALYDSQHGYYSTGKARIGRGGDFFTSVSVGPLFGRLLAQQFVEMWERLGRPAPFDLVEQGAHDGTLACDVVEALHRIAPDCPVRLNLVEPSEHWRSRQREKIMACEVRWFDSPEALPRFVGVHYSNELPDAFPVHLIHRTEDAWRERYVAVAGDAFVFEDHALSTPELADHVARLPDMPMGTVTEVNLEAGAWLRSLSLRLERGFAVIIDYGYPRAEYYAPHRVAGTLEAIAAHRKEPDPLVRPGATDLTAHVDFTTLAEAATAEGMKIAGYTDQHHFLVGLSRLHFEDGVRPSASDLRAFQTLSHPTMLGRAFKVLAVSRGVASEPPLSGFTYAREADTRSLHAT